MRISSKVSSHTAITRRQALSTALGLASLSAVTALAFAGSRGRGSSLLGEERIRHRADHEHEEEKPAPPPPDREFRAAWVATVANIDWPSKRNLTVEQQKSEMTAILDRAVQLKLNAIIFQVRPACDALYPSKLEPWSEYLTGVMGKAPEPFYDPLALWVSESHKRGIELHAWFNPYRAHHPTAKSPLSDDHVSRRQPQITRKYGTHLWLDPGEKATQEHSLRVILDVVKRYDIDGVHLDDYFYPYKEKDASGQIMDFPDEPSWQTYLAGGGTLSRDDWRRDSVDRFIETLYKKIKASKPWVKFGISPFGIWRPGYPAQIQGFDAYSQLYADSRKWLNNGWVDYWTPQLYWPIAQKPQAYPVLLKWWAEQNTQGRNLWPGNYTSRVGESGGKGFSVKEITDQIAATRAQPGATGNVHFSMAALMTNSSGLSDALKKSSYAQPALISASPWLHEKSPEAPHLTVKRDKQTNGLRLTWKPGDREPVARWVAQFRQGGAENAWKTEILPGEQREYLFLAPADTKWVAISAVDRYGNISPASIEATE